jgi:hypothetical protein
MIFVCHSTCYLFYGLGSCRKKLASMHSATSAALAFYVSFTNYTWSNLKGYLAGQVLVHKFLIVGSQCLHIRYSGALRVQVILAEKKCTKSKTEKLYENNGKYCAKSGDCRSNTERYTRLRFFLASILKFVLFLY